MLKICECCENEYKTYQRNQKYCSRSCLGVAKSNPDTPKTEYILRFLRLVNDKVPLNGCWLWQGGKSGSERYDYGNFKYKGKTQKAHRVSYLLFRGDFPQELDVLHTCDNPECVNPWHLFLGTHTDNMTDMMKKGRGNKPFGTRMAASVLNEQQVLEIRTAYSPGNGVKLKEKYGVSSTTISKIIHRQSWKHV
jgi:hypothetical protein